MQFLRPGWASSYVLKCHGAAFVCIELSLMFPVHRTPSLASNLILATAVCVQASELLSICMLIMLVVRAHVVHGMLTHLTTRFPPYLAQAGSEAPFVSGLGQPLRGSKRQRPAKKRRQQATRDNHEWRRENEASGDGLPQGKWPKRMTFLSTEAAEVRKGIMRQYCPQNPLTGEFLTKKDSRLLWDHSFEVYAAKCVLEVHMATYRNEEGKQSLTLKQVITLNRE